MKMMAETKLMLVLETMKRLVNDLPSLSTCAVVASFATVATRRMVALELVMWMRRMCRTIRWW